MSRNHSNFRTMGTPALTSERDRTFDIMKGIGILLMMIGHAYYDFPKVGSIIYTFHMPMFFIVAGYFSKSWTDWQAAKASIRKYLIRLVAPMIFTNVLFLLWEMMMVFVKGNAWSSVISRLTTILWADVCVPSFKYGPSQLGITWFLMALLVAKITLLFLSRLKGWALPISLLAAWASIMLHRVFPYSVWCISLGMTALPFVTIGWWVHNHKVPVWAIVIIVVSWPLTYLWVGDIDMYCFSWPCWPLNVIAACGGTWVLYFFSKMLAKHTKYISGVLAYLGVISLAIMCMHGLEIDTHLGNHLRALLGFELPIWAMYIWRYLLTIVLAIVLVQIPMVKRIFV